MINILFDKKIISITSFLFLTIFSSFSFGQQNKVNGNLIQFSSNGAWCWYQDERRTTLILLIRQLIFIIQFL
ncbi:MAG TPA: hypothetical protein VMT35_00060 [Ignavibacteriaceae bacterium]|nr:hypothetical protein [Ignavibacteriaceae bacterium]